MLDWPALGRLLEATKPHIERMLGSVATMFAQHVSGYTGRNPEYRGRGAEGKAVWSLPELQDMLDQWLIAGFSDRFKINLYCDLGFCVACMFATCVPAVPVSVPPPRLRCLRRDWGGKGLNSPGA